MLSCAFSNFNSHQRFSCVFRGYQIGNLAINRLIVIFGSKFNLYSAYKEFEKKPGNPQNSYSIFWSMSKYCIEQATPKLALVN